MNTSVCNKRLKAAQLEK